METPVEIEVKFSISNLRSLNARLRQTGMRLITRRTHEMNSVFDRPGLSLRKQGSLLRVRKYGKRWTVTFKGKAEVGRYKSRPEIETVVDDGASLIAILESTGFTPVFSYEKFRSEWTDGRGHVVVDETPIGNFGEIEGSEKWIESTAGKLRIPPSQYITDSYSVLFQKWKHGAGSKARNMTFAEVTSSAESR